MRKKVTDYLLYRWRYVLGYGSIGIAIAGLLLVSALYVPGGLSESELRSVVASDTVDLMHLTPEAIVQLPYYLLQKASISLLGLSNLSIKLPSLLLSVASIVGMILLLKSWFRANVAVLTTILVVTASQFLAIAQSGTSSIVYVFCSVWILVAALRVSRQVAHSALWKITLFSLAAISLYTPLSIYILLALLSATILHPHLRYLARRAFKSRLKIMIAAGCAALLVAPLGWAIYQQPSIGLTLLGIPAEWPQLGKSVGDLFNQYFNFISPVSGVLMRPIYALGPLLLIIVGLVQLFTTTYTARGYIITAWTVLLIPALIINPTYTSVTFVPAMLLMAMGVHALLNNWYKLFPKNPYARIAGLLPLTILIGSMVLSGVNRYSYGYLYNPDMVRHFSSDVRLVNREISQHKNPTLIVTEEQQALYTVIANHHATPVTVSTNASDIQQSQSVIVTHDAFQQFQPTATPQRIVTDKSTSQADRFYIYSPQQQ